ncbi:aldo/keto reductase [Salegentibacter salarius]|uniref:Alcohol dehydrogenase n=1 Tax=Salegentibacter salarius TaxID=435906 RepID=A0A2N0U169_9FLAO|nr:aldo/keto reductase [Salegentibacter salarius]OEY73577.1 alcohol dehydrogenase [Salegentibacter salarius]PKD20747.1 alcohol dehydrogenase [Salegentibacter salarius]SLJ95474.1 Predicted oxidoreductase [Salegentibacter salarius]
MKTVELGKSGLKSAPIIFGGNVFGWTLNEKESFKMLDELFERGFNTIDTADVYSRWADGVSHGTSERIIGKWMKERKLRDKITLITKGGSSLQPGGPKNNSRDYLTGTVQDSLLRLQTDYIDLYFTHFDDEETPVEEALEAYHKFMSRGEIKHIGASNFSAERLQKSLTVAAEKDLPGYEVFQPEYNLMVRDKFEGKIEKICSENNLGVIPYFSLASGFLTGKYRKKEDFEGKERKMFTDKFLNQRGERVLKSLDQISEKHNISQAGVALAWLMKRPGVSAPIASATKSSHLKSFTEATEVSLSKEDMEILNKASETE